MQPLPNMNLQSKPKITHKPVSPLVFKCHQILGDSKDLQLLNSEGTALVLAPAGSWLLQAVVHLTDENKSNDVFTTSGKHHCSNSPH